MAKEIHDYYQNKYLDENRIDLPPFTTLQYLALRDFLDDWEFDPNLRLSLLTRIEIERPDLAEKLQPWKEDIEKQRDKVRMQEQELIKSFEK